MTRPSWTPTGGEVWTVMDSAVVARVIIDGTARRAPRRSTPAELAALGPISDLRLSRDGMRVVAVVGGALYTAAVARSIDGEVAIRNIRRLRPDDLGEVVAADWRSAESIVAITRGTEMLVAQVSVDGLRMQGVPGNNLTPPLTAVAAAANRPLLVTDSGGVWSFARRRPGRLASGAGRRSRTRCLSTPADAVVLWINAAAGQGARSTG